MNEQSASVTDAPLEHARPMTVTAGICFLVGALIALLALAILVLTTDPEPEEQQLFAGLTLIAVTGFGACAALLFGSISASPLAVVFRALRRGALLGAAAAGAAVLQFHAALHPTNLAFLLLVLLIVEMVFLARRQPV